MFPSACEFRGLQNTYFGSKRKIYFNNDVYYYKLCIVSTPGQNSQCREIHRVGTVSMAMGKTLTYISIRCTFLMRKPLVAQTADQPYIMLGSTLMMKKLNIMVLWV